MMARRRGRNDRRSAAPAASPPVMASQWWPVNAHATIKSQQLAKLLDGPIQHSVSTGLFELRFVFLLESQ